MSVLQASSLDVRPSAVAGAFYPQDAGELNAMVSSLLARHQGAAASDARRAKAIIAPHAGYAYSGDVSARVYASLAPRADEVDRVILLGPAHRVYFQGVAMSSVTHFASPLGNVRIDLPWQARLQDLDFVGYSDEAHREEHSLEVHLPFLQRVLGDFSLVPLVVGDVGAEQVSQTLDCLWGGDETLIVLSTDLSHYHDYETANRIDEETCRMIAAFEYGSLNGERACGVRPISGLLRQAAQRNMRIERLHRCNSGDTAGDKRRVVGYCAFALMEIADDDCVANAGGTGLLRRERLRLLALARRSIESGLAGKGECPVDLTEWEDGLQAACGVFVTLKIDGRLRGCVGSMDTEMPLPRAVSHLAHAAAFADGRFPPLGTEEYPQVSVGISVLGERTPIAFSSERELIGSLRPGRDGLVIQLDRRQATFLPAVWAELPDAGEFLAHLKRKAGIGHDEMPAGAWRYEAECLEE